MKLQPYVEKLIQSKQYQDFSVKYKDAYLVAGFFVLDFETGKNIHQIDYYIPSSKKVAAFTLDGEVVIQIMDTMGEKVPDKLDIKTNIDLDGLKGVLEDEMKNRNITSSIKKIIAILQNLDGKKIWTLNCILSGMEILRAHVEDKSITVLKMEKASILDYVKKLPPQETQKMPPKEASQEDEVEQINAQLAQLDKIKKELERQKEEIAKEKKEGIQREKNESTLNAPFK